MVWKIKFDKRAEEKFKKLDKQIQKRIAIFLDEKLAVDPVRHSTLLVGSYNKFARARVGDYRIIFELKNDELIIIIINIDHRSKIYQ